MRERIEAKIANWQQGLQQLQAAETQLERRLAEVRADIQRNIGAIQAARELQAALEPAPAEQNGAPKVDDGAMEYA